MGFCLAIFVWIWPFVLRCPSFHLLFGGCSPVWSRSFLTPRHEFCLPLLWVLSSVWSRCSGPLRQVCFAVHFLVKSVLLTSRHEINFCSALFFWWSRCFGPSGTSCFLPLMWASSFCGAGVFGPLDEFISCGALLWKNCCFWFLRPGRCWCSCWALKVLH